MTFSGIGNSIARRGRNALLFVFGPLFNSIAANGRNPGSPGSEKKNYDLILCVVAGPGETRGLKDLIESARCYLEGSYRIILVDDSGGISVFRIARGCPEVSYLRNRKRHGFRHYDRSLRKAYSYALENFHFHSLIKMDTDTLIVGPGLISAIRSYLDRHPRAGMLGSHRVTCTGSERDFSPGVVQLRRSWKYWKDVIEEAEERGYELGENVQGGSYIFSCECLEAMRQEGFLGSVPGGDFVAEDTIFPLYARAAGYEIHDFAKEGQPLAIAWKGLPMPVEDIVEQRKMVIHSVKFGPGDLRIREYFRNLRTRYSISSGLAG